MSPANFRMFNNNYNEIVYGVYMSFVISQPESSPTSILRIRLLCVSVASLIIAGSRSLNSIYLITHLSL
jgi:hypothetical protein